MEARKRRRAEELQGLRGKLEALKVEKHAMVSQLKQVKEMSLVTLLA